MHSQRQWMVLAVAVFSSLILSSPLLGKAYCRDIAPQKLERPNYDVVYVCIPANKRYSIIPVVSPKLELLPDLVNRVKDVAVAGINAGYFDPRNKQTTSYVVAQGQVLVNPVENRSFVENPDLFPYISQMLNRSEFRVMECNGKQKYAIARHQDKPPFRCKILHSIQAGPDLYKTDAIETEAFVAYNNKQRVRDPIGVDAKNARSAIGIDEDGSVILAMAAQKPVEGEATGVSLHEMAHIMRELGAVQALNFDGGSSSTLWVGGETFFGKLDSAFNPVKRPIKSALVVIREE